MPSKQVELKISNDLQKPTPSDKDFRGSLPSTAGFGEDAKETVKLSKRHMSMQQPGISQIQSRHHINGDLKVLKDVSSTNALKAPLNVNF